VIVSLLQISIFCLAFKKLTISEAIVELFCELPKAFIHSQITIANIEPPSRASPGAPSMFSLVPCIAPRSHRQVLTADTRQTDETLVRREATSIRPVDSGLQAAAARALPPPALVRTARHVVAEPQRMASTTG
jgi:hypothetical protein